MNREERLKTVWKDGKWHWADTGEVVNSPLQRLSEIIEAGTPGDLICEKPGKRGTWIGTIALSCGNTDAEADDNATLIVSAVRLSRFLCSPEAVEVLARELVRLEWPHFTPSEDLERWVDLHWGQQTSRAEALLNTIAEQALKGPSPWMSETSFALSMS